MQTERISLRRFEQSDGDWLYDLDNDPDVMRYINGGCHTPRRFILERSLPFFRQRDALRPELGFWVVERNGEAEPLGWCCLRSRGVSADRASLGYRFKKTAWGHGYATEASRLLLRLGFVDLHLSAISATTYEENERSRRVLDRLGFRILRRFRLDLSQQTTAYFESIDPWPGMDLEYILERECWATRHDSVPR